MRIGITCDASCIMLITLSVTGVSRSRILIDSTYDSRPDDRAWSFIAPYKLKVDSIMSPWWAGQPHI